MDPRLASHQSKTGSGRPAGDGCRHRRPGPASALTNTLRRNRIEPEVVSSVAPPKLASVMSTWDEWIRGGHAGPLAPGLCCRLLLGWQCLRKLLGLSQYFRRNAAVRRGLLGPTRQEVPPGSTPGTEARQFPFDVSAVLSRDHRTGVYRVVANLLWKSRNATPAGYSPGTVYFDTGQFREVAGAHAFFFDRSARRLSRAIQEWLQFHASGKIPSFASLPCQIWRDSDSQLIQVPMNNVWYLSDLTASRPLDGRVCLKPDHGA